MTDRSIVYGAFTVERQFTASPERSFAAFADPKIKARWFGGGSDATTWEVFEFRVGGREFNAGKGPDGSDYTFDVRYYDIVENERIVYAYDMTLNGARISVSLATVEFKPEGPGTRLVINEYGTFLDGLDNVEQRRTGTEWLIGQLGTVLDAN